MTTFLSLVIEDGYEILVVPSVGSSLLSRGAENYSIADIAPPIPTGLSQEKSAMKSDYWCSLCVATQHVFGRDYRAWRWRRYGPQQGEAEDCQHR